MPAQEISRIVQALLERLAGSRRRCRRRAAPAAADIRAQLAWLVPAGFLLTTPWERLKEFPRYLQAIEQRLEKLGRDPRRDAQLAAEIAPLEARYRERVKAERGLRPPGEDEFRWHARGVPRVAVRAAAQDTRARSRRGGSRTPGSNGNECRRVERRRAGYASAMSQSTDPVHDALARYSAAAYDKDVDAFVSLYADDLHVFDMWNSWELRGIGAWRRHGRGVVLVVG